PGTGCAVIGAMMHHGRKRRTDEGRQCTLPDTSHTTNEQTPSIITARDAAAILLPPPLSPESLSAVRRPPLTLLLSAFPERIEQQAPGTDRDRRIGHVEGGEVMRAPMEVDEIDHIAVHDAVDDIP